MHEGHRDRMRQQLRQSGMDSLSDVQVIEVLLYHAFARQDTNLLAHALLKRFGSLTAIREASIEQLATLLPAPTAQAVYDHFHQQEEA